jgi:hypothetical protein
MSNHYHLRHYTKMSFRFISLTVMALEVAAFLVFLFGSLGAILGTYSGISTTDFILLGFGGIFAAFVLLAGAEILQVLLKIEFGVRKSDGLVQQELDIMRAEEKKLNAIWAIAQKQAAKAAPKKKKAPAKKAAPKKRAKKK